MTRRSRKSLAVAAGFRLVREGQGDKPCKTPIRWPKDVFALMEPYTSVEPNEVFWLIALDSQHCTTVPVVVTRGTLNSSLVAPREVFIRAIISNAAAIILVHNHPSGDPTPSADDRAITNQLVQAGKILNIPVQDHIIMGEGRYISFAEAGLL